MNFNNINSDNLPNLIYLSLLLILLVSNIIFRSHLKSSELLKQAFYWLALVLAILIAYSFRYDLYKIKDQVATELFPSYAQKNSQGQIVIALANDGHFYIDAQINQKPVHFMVDTGASDITLNLSDAHRIGITADNFSTFKKYQTANGVVFSGLTQVKEIEIAGIKFNNVAVSVNNGDMGTSLLGMSFLQRFKKYEFYQDRLILTYQ